LILLVIGSTIVSSLIGTAWATRRPVRTVLGIVHNITSATRLFDVIPLLAHDPRVQVFFTCTGSSPFTAGAHEYLAAREVTILSWPDAVRLNADLAIATSHGGGLHELSIPLIILPHGMGYNKYLTPKTENRKPKTENPVFGFRFVSGVVAARGRAHRVVPGLLP
jgi:hypothetical protein